MLENPKVLLGLSLSVFLASYLIAVYEIDIPLPKFPTNIAFSRSKDTATADEDTSAASEDRPGGKSSAAAGSAGKTKRNKNSKGGDAVVLTVKELSKYGGGKGSKGLYLAMLGKVYNVEKGKQHYGPGGGYSFFSGKDGTRAFITGDFTAKGLIDDVSGLSPGELLGLEEWQGFYEKDYTFVGYLEGTYYDSAGNPTAKLDKVLADIEIAKGEQAKEKKLEERFPPCNSEWSQDKGSRVWCTNQSGGIKRDWVGVPRKFYKSGGSSRCACVKNTGQSFEGTGNRGDLDNPSLKPYDNCKPNSNSCNL